MEYKNITKARFIKRINRFVAIVNINGNDETVHVKNTGRCKELLLENAVVYLEKTQNEHRKTKYDLIAVLKDGNKVVNIDSQLPNTLVYEWIGASGLFSDNAVFKREVKYKNSRFDLYAKDGERKAFIEVKGVTLEENGTALFPDAPTERGVKHLNELMDAVDEGYETYVVFVIQMKGVTSFCPNAKTHSAFAGTLKEAKERGVKLIALDCRVEPSTVFIDKAVDIKWYLL